MILPVFLLSILLFTFKKGSGGPAMESLGTGTGRRKASLHPRSQRFHRWFPI